MFKKIAKVVGVVAGVIALLLGALVAVVEVRAGRRHDVPLPAIRLSKDPAVIARGEYLAQGPGTCAMCHVAEQDARLTQADAMRALRGGFVFALPGFGTFRPANLTSDPRTGVGRRTPGEIARAIRHGVNADGTLAPFMAIHANGMADDDLEALVSYLYASEAVSNDAGADDLGLIGKAMVAFAFQPAVPPPMATAPAPAPTVERGRYLAERVAYCAFCHTRHDPVSMAESAPRYSGGMPNPSVLGDPSMEFAAPNLTPYEGGALAKFDEEAFVARFRAGKLIPDSPMPWQAFGHMTEDDLRAIYRHLRSVPVVDNDNGPTHRKVGWRPGEDPLKG